MKPAPLTGLAVGDALGMPFETSPPDRYDLVEWDGVNYVGDGPGNEYHGLKPGQWTDDTQMSCALARSLVQMGGYIPSHVSAAYLDWFDDAPRGYGKTTKLAMDKLRETRKWAGNGIPGAEGNGTAMRVTPIGVRYTDLEDLRKFAGIDAIITHDSTEARTASIALATMISGLLSGMGKVEALDYAIEQQLYNNTSNTLMVLADKLIKPVGPVYYLREKGPSARVQESMPAAVEAFLITDTFQDAVVTAIKFGGDTDTVAAMTGALAGSFYGYDAIPEHWRAGLEDAAKIRALEIELLGQRSV